MPSPGVASTWGAELFAAYVLDHLATESVLLRSGARRINVTGAAAHVPRLLTDGSAAWVAEAAEIGSTAPDADEIVLTPKKLANTVVLSNESVADNEVDVLDAVGFALTRSVATALDTAAFDATVASATRPAGLRSAGYTLPTAVGTVADAAGVDAIRVAVGTVLTAGGHPNAIYLSAADYVTLQNLKDGIASSIRPLLQPDVTKAGALSIAGCTLYPTPGFPAGAALIADSSQIVVGVRKDIRVDISPHQKFTADSVVARVVARFDWSVNDTDGLYLIT